MNKIKKNIYINTFLLLAAMFSLLYVNCFYLTKKIENFNLEVVDKKKRIEKLDAQNKQIESVRIEIGELRKNANEIFEYIIDYSSIVNFVTEARDAAKNNNADLEMKVSNGEKILIAEGLSSIDYNIKITGKFSDVIRFLNYLENSKYYTNVEKIKISSNFEKGSANNEIVIDSSLKVYVWN